MAIDGLLIVRKVVKVIFGKEKGKFRLTDWDGEVAYLAASAGKGKKRLRFGGLFGGWRGLR